MRHVRNTEYGRRYLTRYVDKEVASVVGGRIVDFDGDVSIHTNGNRNLAFIRHGVGQEHGKK
jgi:hypothetical protein